MLEHTELNDENQGEHDVGLNMNSLSMLIGNYTDIIYLRAHTDSFIAYSVASTSVCTSLYRASGRCSACGR